MKFCLIASEKSDEEVRQIMMDEAQKLFDSVLYVPLKKIRIECRKGKTRVMFKNTDLSEFDAAYLRVFGDDFVFGEVVLDALGNTDIFLATSPEAYQMCNHKYFTVKALSKIGVPSLNSSLAITPKTAVAVAKKIGFPVVVKLLRGFGGKGVMLANSEKEFTPILDTLQVFEEFIATQEFVPGIQSDMRCYVFGKTVYGIRRSGEGDEWRSNLSRGGKAEKIELDENLKEMAVRSAELLGLEVGAIDFLETPQGYRLVEANFTPGVLYPFFGPEFGKRIVSYIFRRAKKEKNGKGK